MTAAGQKHHKAPYAFDLVKRNLPEQETDEEDEPLSVLEFICWMLGISVVFFILHYLYPMIFSS